MTRSKQAISAFTCIVLSVGIGTPATAADENKNLTFRVTGAYLESDGDASENITSVGDTSYVNSYSLEIGNGDGVGFSLEYLMDNGHVGFDFGVLFAGIDGTATVRTTGGGTPAQVKIDTEFEPISFGITGHLLPPQSPLDIYAGAQLSFVHYSDTAIKVNGLPGVFEIDDDLGYSVSLGLDYKMGASQQWRLTSSLRYLYTDTLFSLDFQAPDGSRNIAPLNVTVSPWIAQLGVGYTF